jgi:hypothetical protein
MSRIYRIAGMEFRTKDELTAHVSRILNDGTLPSDVDPTHGPLLRALLELRPEKVAEVAGRTIERFVRDKQPPPLQRTRCFWMVFTNGKRLDLSVYEAIKIMKPTKT